VEYLAAHEVGETARHDGRSSLSYVLLPGLGADGNVMSLVGEALAAADIGFVALEAPGFGPRHPKESGVSLGEAADVVMASGKLPGRPAIYVGHSAGAMEAIELAVRDLLAKGSVVVNGKLDEVSMLIDKPPRRAWRFPRKAYFMAALLVYLTGWLPKFVLRSLEKPGHPLTRLLRPMVAQPDKLSDRGLQVLVRHNRHRSAWRHFRANRHYDLLARADNIKVPVLVIHGEHDPLATSPGCSAFVRRLQDRGIPVEVIAFNAGHCLPVELPEAVAAATIGFGEELPR